MRWLASLALRNASMVMGRSAVGSMMARSPAQ